MPYWIFIQNILAERLSKVPGSLLTIIPLLTSPMQVLIQERSNPVSLRFNNCTTPTLYKQLYNIMEFTLADVHEENKMYSRRLHTGAILSGGRKR